MSDEVERYKTDARARGAAPLVAQLRGNARGAETQRARADEGSGEGPDRTSSGSRWTRRPEPSSPSCSINRPSRSKKRLERRAASGS